MSAIRGFFFALPISMLLWAGIILGALSFTKTDNGMTKYTIMEYNPLYEQWLENIKGEL